jgi:hypothetical protein
MAKNLGHDKKPLAKTHTDAGEGFNGGKSIWEGHGMGTSPFPVTAMSLMGRSKRLCIIWSVPYRSDGDNSNASRIRSVHPFLM